jgi:hypothetical protein
MLCPIVRHPGGISVRGMEDVHDARFCGVTVAARVRRDPRTRSNMLLSFNLASNLFFKKKLESRFSIVDLDKEIFLSWRWTQRDFTVHMQPFIH